MQRISIHVTTKDRYGELAVLLQSLRTQTYKDWDLVLLDESSIPVTSSELVMKLIARIKLENHYVNLIRNELSLGVCNARNELIKKDYFNNPLICRLDDDVVIEQDYLDKLVEIIIHGYDIASGVTPLLFQPELIRDISKVIPIINKKEYDKQGNITYYGDDCGYSYNKEKVLLAHEFRSCALMKKEVVDKIHYEENLSPVGFREEGFFSIRAMKAGFKIGVNTHAVAYHFVSSAGGCRFPDYPRKVQSDDNYFKKWVKEQW